MIGRPAFCVLALLLAALLIGTPAHAAQVYIAVAANFRVLLEDLLPTFTHETGHRTTVSSGSTGKLFAQIRHGAPYDVFLAADEARPARLEALGLGVPGSRVTYALGRLALWSPKAGAVDARGEVLKSGFGRLAIAAPKTAPYGRAAQETLIALGLWRAVRARLVQGEDIAQTFQFAHSGNADLAFIALAQIRQIDGRGSFWVVPASLHAPIAQQAVLLERGRDNPAAHALLDYLHRPTVRAALARAGYETP